MRVFYLFGLLFLGVVICRNVGDESNKLDSSDEKTMQMLWDKCKEVGGELTAKKFSVTLEATISCLESQAPKNKDEMEKEINPNNEKELVCSDKRKAVEACFVELVEVAKDCAVEQEKYAPAFFFEALDTLLDFVCLNDGKVLKELAQRKETIDCAIKIKDLVAAGNMTYVCTENFKLLHDNDDNIITKPELCEDLHSAKTCYSAFLNRECPEAKDLNSFLVGVFDAVSSPCTSTTTKLTRFG